MGCGAPRARDDGDLDGVRDRDRADRRPCDMTVAPFDPAAASVRRREWDYRVFTRDSLLELRAEHVVIRSAVEAQVKITIQTTDNPDV